MVRAARRKAPSPVGLPNPLDLAYYMCAQAKRAVDSASQRLEERRAEKVASLPSQEELEEDATVATMLNSERMRRQVCRRMGMPITAMPGGGGGAPALDVVEAMQYTCSMPGTDMDVSRVGMGLGAATGSYRYVRDESLAVATVQQAYALGVNFFDTSPIHGHDRLGERAMGQAFRGLPRESFYACTKVGRYLNEVEDKLLGGTRYQHSKNYSGVATRESVFRSLEAMELDYLDIVWVQDPHFSTSYRAMKNGTLDQLQTLQKEGYVKHVGLAGYDMSVLDAVLYTDMKDALRGQTSKDKWAQVVQVPSRYNMLDRSLTSTHTAPYRFIEHCHSRNVGVVNAAPLAMGLFSQHGPPHWHPASELIRSVCRKVVERCTERGVDVARIAMHFAFNSKWSASHLVGMGSPEEAVTAVSAMTGGLSGAEAECLNWALDKLDRELDVRWWKEKEATYTGRGILTDENASAQHYDDRNAAYSAYIKTPGTTRQQSMQLTGASVPDV